MIRIIVLWLLAFAAHAADIELSWTPPTVDTNGNNLAVIDGYSIYYSVNNTPQPVINVSGTSSSYTLSDVVSGSHTFQITGIANGLEGEKSDPINVSTEAGKPVKIELTVRVVK